MPTLLRPLALLLIAVAGLLLAQAQPGPQLHAQGSTPEGSPTLLKDLNQGSIGTEILWGSALGKNLLFTFRDERYGEELWISDGTASGTYLLKDIYPGPNGSLPSSVLEIRGVSYFMANDGVHGRELWRSDGTPAGTFMLRDIHDVHVADHISLNAKVAFQGKLYFRTSSSRYLWRSDGTPEGTVVVAENIEPAKLVATDDRIWFYENGSAYSINNLWVSDGTAAGTRQVIPPDAGTRWSGTYDIATAGGRSFFTTGSAQPSSDRIYEALELWVSDGTAAGTRQLLQLTPTETAATASEDQIQIGPPGPPVSRVITSLVEHRGLLYFIASGRELWRSDGTPEGTIKLDLSGVGSIISSGNSLFFSTRDGFFAGDGTLHGSVRLFPPSNGTNAGRGSISNVLPLDDTLYVSLAGDEGGEELWAMRANPPSAARVADIIPGPRSSKPLLLDTAGGLIFFTADSITHGNELWVSDGTAAGTRLVSDLTTRGAASNPQRITPVGDRFFVFTNSEQEWEERDEELWVSDGTTAGTQLVTRFPLGWHAGPAWSLGGQLVFIYRDSAQRSELWVSDGTAEGTKRLLDPAQARPFFGTAQLGDRLLFIAVEGEQYGLWVTDGTPTGTQRLRSVQYTMEMTAADGVAYYGQFMGVDCALWRSDGTIAETAVFQPLPRGSNGQCLPVYQLTAVGERLFFSDSPPSSPGNLWVSDSTGIHNLGNLEPFHLSAVGNKLLFFSDQATGGAPPARRLWVSDGTAEGTYALREVPGPNWHILSQWTVLGDRLFFFDAETQLWVSDGTPAGTRRLNSSDRTAYYHYMFDPEPRAIGGAVLFNGYDPEAGIELWRSDGTPEGTYRVFDISPGPKSAVPKGFTLFGNQLLFAATNPEYGRELWSVTLPTITQAPALVGGAPGGRAAITLRFPEIGPSSQTAESIQITLPTELTFAGSLGGSQPATEGGTVTLPAPPPTGLFGRRALTFFVALPENAAYGTRYPVTITLPGENASTLTVEVMVSRQLFLPHIAR